MTGRLRGWRALSWRERGSLSSMGMTLPLIATSLRWFGYRRTRQWLEHWSPCAGAHAPTAQELQSAERLAVLADIAGRHGLVTATCLRQSLWVYWRLRRRGLDPVLKIGVRKQATELAAHAWVELAGTALAQGDLPHRPFASPEPTS